MFDTGVGIDPVVGVSVSPKQFCECIKQGAEPGIG